LFLYLIAIALPLSAEEGVLGEFQLVERFGVPHPDQIVYFDLPEQIDQASAILVDDRGESVPFQVMRDGRLALRTDLPSGATKRWVLRAGKGSTKSDRRTGFPARRPASLNGFGTGQETHPTGRVNLAVKDTYYEITNELIGIRVPKLVGNLANGTPAPIQGLCYQDGTWTALGPNYMDRPAHSMEVNILESGPLVVRMEISYVFDRKQLKAQFEKEVIPAGTGPYRSTIEVQAGQPSILIEEYSEVDVSYSVSVYNGLEPTEGRYRGHHATSVDAGRDSKGGQYGAIQTGAGVNYVGARGHEDALISLQYSGPLKDRWSSTRYKWMSHWDPWAVNTGYYWQLYAPNDPTDNLFGIFAGRPSRLIGPGWSGVSVDARTIDTAEHQKHDARIRIHLQRLTPMQTYARRIRFGWGIFLGKRSDDLKPPTQSQSIGRQMNLHAGVNLTKLKGISGDYPDPVSGYGGMYMGPAASRRIAEMLQAEHAVGKNDLYKILAVDGNLQPLLRLWRTPNREEAMKLYNDVIDFANYYVETVVNGPGIYDHRIHYFHGSMNFAANLVKADQLLASDLLTPEERTKLKTALALFGTMLWDDDKAPMHPDARVNLGPANMSAMWRGTRYAYTVYLARHPFFSERVAAAKQAAIQLLNNYVNDHGACSACAHYTGASMVPILNLMQQLQVRRVADLFAELPKIKRYGEWELQLLTPPEVRFGGKRKIIAVGDGSTENSTRIGQLATGVTPGDSRLGARLMGAWKEMGGRHSSFYGTSVLKIDGTLPTASPNLGDDQFEGWLSVLRHGWGTPDESAVYLVSGDYLTDHRHNDMGTVIIYALGAPLSIDWGPIYYPRVAGSMMHSTVTPEYLLATPWNADNTPLDKPAGGGGRADWWHTRHTPLVSKPDYAAARASWQPLVSQPDKDVEWQRTVRSIRPDPAHPVFVIDDRFTGNDAVNLPMISTLNMMATGPVQTPAGPITPEKRTYDWRDKANQQFPSAGTVINLQPGVNRLQFTGQWMIDWDLYIDIDEPSEITIGNWGHTWAPHIEGNEFRQSQNRPFEERQHILRLRARNRFRTIIIPYRKGRRPENLSVEREGGGVIIQNGPVKVRVEDKKGTEQ